MQQIANWTNLSETTFVLPPSAAEADYRVRIFTPSVELPFAGHPTLGTCHAWLEMGGAPKDAAAVVQECAAGLVRIRRGESQLAFAAPPLLRSGPVDEADVERVARMLGIPREDIVDAQWADNGPGWVAVMLRDAGRRPGPEARRPRGHGGRRGRPPPRGRPTTPTSMSSRSPGFRASTAPASRSMTATQPGPLSAHWASTMSSRAIPSIRATRATSASSTGPDRSNGGAANANARPAGPAPAPPRTPAPPPAVLRRTAHLEPRVARPQRGMPGERQLDRRREDPHAIVGLTDRRREHERRLGEVRSSSPNLLHVGVRDPARVEHDRHRVPAVRLGRERVDLGERALHRPKSARRHAFTRSLQLAGTFQVASRTWVGVGHSGWV